MANFAQIGGVAGGAAIGALLRAGAMQWLSGNSLVALLAVNSMGCMLAGMVLAWALAKDSTLYAFAVIGVLGGFTTYAGVVLQALERMATDGWLQCVAVLVLHGVSCGIAAVFGYRLLLHFHPA